MTIRDYSIHDRARIRELFTDRELDEQHIDQIMREISPYGVIVENYEGRIIGYMGIYLSVGIGIAFVHEMVMDIGIDMKTAREIGSCLIAGMIALCIENDYSRVYTTVNSRALARQLVNKGFIQDPNSWYNLTYNI